MMDELTEMCKALRLAHTARIFEDIQFENPRQFLEGVLSKELQLREADKIERHIKKARFLQRKSLSDFQWHEQIHLPNQLDIKALEELHFIREKENLILTGSPGTGKTHLATAIGYEACNQGMEVLFYRVSDLVADLEKAWKNDRLTTFHRKFKNVDLIILDEMGYVPFNTDGAELFFQLISEWYEQKSLIITSNLEFSQWNRIFGDSRLTAALVDRVIHHAHILNFMGDSFRITHALSRNN